MNKNPSSLGSLSKSSSAFTLVELLVVITILGILMGLAVGGAGAIKTQARNTQARNDCVGISSAIRSFYTDYSRYPIPSTKTDDAPFEPEDSSKGNQDVVSALIAQSPAINPRGTVYYENKLAKVNSAGLHTGGIFENAIFDPWGYTYGISVDGDYDGSLQYTGKLLKYYSSSPGDVKSEVWTVISGGVGVFSLGKDQCKSDTSSPGILSWY
jgi:prepilin-type N-terminal cleavage/methylation domain-containing protein